MVSFYIHLYTMHVRAVCLCVFVCVWERQQDSVKIPCKFHSNASHPVSPLQGRVTSGSAHFWLSQMIGGSVCCHGWVPHYDIKSYWRRPEFRGGVRGDRRLLAYDWFMTDSLTQPGRPRRTEEQGVKVSLVYCIGLVALALVILF